MSSRPTYEELEDRVKSLEAELHRHKTGRCFPAGIGNIPGDGDDDTLSSSETATEETDIPPLRHLLDIPRLQILLDGLFTATGIPSAILDRDENILTASGWQDICVKFHRVHPRTKALCKESDRYIKSNMPREGYVGYECANGLWDFAFPIRVDDRHVGTFFFGQVFLDTCIVDRECFRERARTFGFDEADYLRALDAVPVISRGTLETTMQFCKHLVTLIVSLAMQNLAQSRMISENRFTSERPRDLSDRLSSAVLAAGIGIWEYNPETGVLSYDESARSLYGIDSNTPVQHGCGIWRSCIHPADRARIDAEVKAALQNGTVFQLEFRIVTPGGEVRHIRGAGDIVRNPDQTPKRMIGVNWDVTGYKRVLAELDRSNRLMEAVIRQAPFAAHVVAGGLRSIGVLIENDESRRIMGEPIAGRTDIDAFDAWSFQCRFFTSDGETEVPLHRMPGIRALQGEAIRNEEYMFRYSDGVERLVEASASPVYGDGGEIEAAVVTFHDITYYKRMEQALRRSEADLARAQRIANIGSWSMDLDKHTAVWSDAMYRILGLSPGDPPEPTLQTGFARVHPEDRDRLRKTYQRCLQAGENRFELFFRTVPIRGETRYIRVLAEVERNADQTPRRIFGVDIDVTDRVRAEAAIGEAERQKRSILDAIPNLILLHDPDLRITWANRSACEAAGMSREALTGRYCYEIWPKNATVCLDCPVDAAMKTGEAKEAVKTMGRDRIWHIIGSPVKDESGAVAGAVGITADITEARKAEGERHRLAAAVEQAAESVVITDTQGTVQYVNPAFERTTGYSKAEILGENPRILQSGEHDTPFYEEMWNTLKSGRIWTGRIVNKRKNGTRFTEECAISPVRDENGVIQNYVAVKHDVTHTIELEDQLRHAQKMEALGTMAGGIAHDFNNILFPILGYAEMTLETVSDETARQYLEQIVKAGHRARDLVSQILSFSRKLDSRRAPVKPGPLIKEALKLMRATFPATVEIRPRISKTGFVAADLTQLHQVVVNLCTNAVHAMQADGGVLTVDLTETHINGDSAEAPAAAKPGKYVVFTVSDTGVGMETDVAERVFEPYFTTKQPGEGTGLGLSVVDGIVRDHGGFITLESRVGAGSTFRVFLPVEGRDPAAADAPKASPAPGGGESVLVVDDEPEVTDLLQRMLESLGYRVTPHTEAHAALAEFRNNPDAFDLVITDMIMPKMTGDVLAQEVRALRPDLPILVVTGIHDGVREEKLRGTGVSSILLKPVCTGELAERVRRALDTDL